MSENDALTGTKNKFNITHVHNLKTLLLFAFVLCAFFPSLQCGFIWDDDYHIELNPTFGSLSGLKTIWFPFAEGQEKIFPVTVQYYPLVYSSFWLEHQLWELDPFGYHLTNVLLHALSSFILWKILRMLRIPGSWLCAVLFAIHPVHVESVAWASERKNVLSGFFYLLSFYYYWVWCYKKNSLENQRNNKLYPLSIFLFTCAMLSKSVTCSLPVIILLIQWWKSKKIQWHRVTPLLPFFAIGLILGLLTVRNEVGLAGATGEDWNFSFIDRCLIASRAFWFYFEKLIWPHPLIFVYPRWSIDSSELWQYSYLAFAILLFTSLWFLRKRISLGPLIGFSYFAITLFPALGFFNVYPMIFSFVADHFQYLASLGPLIIIGSTLSLLKGKLKNHFRFFFYLFSASILTILTSLTWNQCHEYKDVATLWESTLKKNPNAWLALNNLGVILQNESKFEEAKPYFYKAIELYPRNKIAHFNLGSAFQEQEKYQEAIDHYYLALKYDPAYKDVHPKLGYILQRTNQTQEAARIYRMALKYNPNNFSSHNNLGNIYKEEEQYTKALYHFKRVLEIDPIRAQDLQVKEKIDYLKEKVNAKSHASNPNTSTK